MLKPLSFLGLLISLSSWGASLPKKLVLAYEPNYLNHSQSDNANPIVKQLAENMGLELEYYQCPWARCMKAAQLGQVDIIDHLYKSSDREAFLTFLYPPYAQYDATFRFYGLNQRSLQVSSFDDIKPLTIGAVRGNVYFELFDNDSSIKKVMAVSEDQLFELVRLGRIDAFIASSQLTEEMVKQRDPDGRLVVLGYQHIEEKTVHVAVSKKSHWQQHIPELEKKLKTLINTQKHAHQH